MIVGWKRIEQATGLSRKLLRRLRDEEGFPLTIVGNRPATSRHLVDQWLGRRIRCTKGIPLVEISSHGPVTPPN